MPEWTYAIEWIHVMFAGMTLVVVGAMTMEARPRLGLTLVSIGLIIMVVLPPFAQGRYWDHRLAAHVSRLFYFKNVKAFPIRFTTSFFPSTTASSTGSGDFSFPVRATLKGQ